MKIDNLPQNMSEVLLRDAAERDLTTKRRALLCRILYHERYLTRDQLIVRVESWVGKGCFGSRAWEDTFFRDMRLVRQALKAEGYLLRYSRKQGLEGYYLAGEPRISETLQRIFAGAAAEIDPRQMEVVHRLTTAERFQIGCSMTDAVLDARAYRLREKNPELDEAESHRLALILDSNHGG